MKRFFILLFAFILIIPVSLFFTGCNSENEPHKHNIVNKWLTDATHHYHKCVECNDVVDKEIHSFIDGECIVCEYSVTPIHNHNWKLIWSNNETHHWNDCSDETCNEICNKEIHSFVNNKCIVCEYLIIEEELEEDIPNLVSSNNYYVEDVDGTVSATFTIGGVTESLVAMKGSNVIGDALVFRATDLEEAGNLMFPEAAFDLTAQNDNVVIQYTYSNTGDRHYIASIDFAANIFTDNMKVEYSIDGTNYSEDCYAIVVQANSNNKNFWIKISIIDATKPARIEGDFNWIINGCDPLSEDYLEIGNMDYIPQ